MRLRSIAMLALIGATSALLLAACSDEDGGASAMATPTATMTASPTASSAASPTTTARAEATPTATAEATRSPVPTATATAPRPPLTPDAVALVPALDGRTFGRPVEFGAYPIGGAGGSGGDVYVVEQDGLVLGFHAGEQRTLLDLRARVSRSGNEEGLLSLALDPAFRGNGHVWLYYSVAGGERRTRLARFTADLAGDGAIDPASELVVLEQPQPFSNHNGGAIRFGPDGMLYLGLGDGGSGGDPRGNGQNRNTLLGSVIRIDVRDASSTQPYVVPDDNPFVGTPDARDEIWAYGLRNPWRMAFDPATGALWLADVGQNAWEEIDVIERGANYGWNRTEGFECFSPPSGCDRTGLTDPIAAYSHDAGCSVSGGFVYRGDGVSALAGHYVYGDFCSGTLWAIEAAGRGEPIRLGSTPGRIAGFGVDGAGELYVLLFDGPILQFVAP